MASITHWRACEAGDEVVDEDCGCVGVLLC